MTTPRIRSLVSLALGLMIAGCASVPAQLATDAPMIALRFDNGARDYVHVYLVGEQREWLLGRVEPGARATLRIPEEAAGEGAGMVRLAVLAGSRVTMRAASEPRATITIAQPAAEIVAQRWTFSKPLAQGRLSAVQLTASCRSSACQP